MGASWLIASAYAKSSPPANGPHHFSPATSLDSLLDANPIPLPAVKPADIETDANSAPPGTNPAVSTPSASDTSATSNTPAVFYQIQLDALSDIDSAQARKAVLEQALGSKIDMVFDPPFYKLRYGNFPTKQEAEDALTDLAEKNMQGFIVRQ